MLDPHPPRSGTELREAIEVLARAAAATADDMADALLEVRGSASLDELACDSGGGEPSSPFRAGSQVMADRAAQQLRNRVATAVSRFHEENRLRPGIPKATLSSSLGVDPDAVTLVVAGSDALIDDGATIRLAEFSPGMSIDEQMAWGRARAMLEQGLAVPRASQLGLEPDLLHALLRAEQLMRIADDLVYLPEQVAAIVSKLDELPSEFTVADFRDEMGITRRQAIPLLEWLDSRGLTLRRGDIRVVR